MQAIEASITKAPTHSRLPFEASPVPTTRTAAHASSMAAEPKEEELTAALGDGVLQQHDANNCEEDVDRESEEDEADEEDGDEDADEEPKLKYTRLTSSLAPVYRNGDATSTFMVAGDKMVQCISLGPKLSFTPSHMLIAR